MPPKFGGGGNMCKRCNKTVYQAEEKKDPKGGYWHSSCFTCKNCPNNNKSTRLDSTNINIHKGTVPDRYCNQTEFEFFTISSFPLSLWRQCSAAKGMGRGLFQPTSVTHWPRSSLACSLLDSDRIHWKLLLHIALVQTCPTSFPGPLPWYLEWSWEQGILDGIYFQYNSSEKTFFSLRWNLLQGVLWSSVWPQRLRIWRRSWRLNSNTVEDFKARRLHFFFWI